MQIEYSQLLSQYYSCCKFLVDLHLMRWRKSYRTVSSDNLLRWEKQIEADSNSGKLDFLINVGLAEYQAGEARDF